MDFPDPQQYFWLSSFLQSRIPRAWALFDTPKGAFLMYEGIQGNHDLGNAWSIQGAHTKLLLTTLQYIGSPRANNNLDQDSRAAKIEKPLLKQEINLFDLL